MLKLFQVDAFCETLFEGNPAAVVPLKSWPSDTLLQSIAAENNLAETAFLVPAQQGWELRWFTPSAEVALCGHATLASAHVLINHYGADQAVLNFYTRESGTLCVSRNNDNSLSMTFPGIALQPVEDQRELANLREALGVATEVILKGDYSAQQFDYLVVVDDEITLRNFTPDIAKFKQLGSRGVIVSAKGQSCDFASRYFAPNVGIDEDPVTGSAHCLLTPYWAQVLQKTTLQAKQLSARGGTLRCDLLDEQVILTGHAVEYLVGQLNISDV